MSHRSSGGESRRRSVVGEYPLVIELDVMISNRVGVDLLRNTTGRVTSYKSS